MKILHLYYDLMNLYGEYGNVVVLAKHLEDQGEEVIVDEKTIDKAIRNCDYAYGTAEIKDVNGKWAVFHSGKYVQEFDNSDDAEVFVREKGWH